MDVRRGDVDAELHPQRPAELQLLLEAACGQDVDGVPRQVGEGHSRARLPRFWRSFGEIARRPRRRRIRKLRLLALLAVLGLLGSAAFTFGLLTAVAAKIPQLDPSTQRTQANTYVYAANGHTVLAILRGEQARIVVPSEAISPWLKHAIVAIEDKRFYEHRGVDIRGMARALWADVSSHGTVQGGSTITQQFVKNAYLTSQKTIGRKLVEAALAWQLEQRWTKDRILTAYLNTVYFGNGAYGVEQASRDLLPPPRERDEARRGRAPRRASPRTRACWDPVAHPKAARRAATSCCGSSTRRATSRTSQYVNSLVYPMPDPSKDVSALDAGGRRAVLRELRQGPARQALRAARRRSAAGCASRRRSTRPAADSRATRSSPCCRTTRGRRRRSWRIDVQTGAVLAMVGGENYHKSQFNLATQGERQPGSAFKPFVLATALQEDIAPSSDPHLVEASDDQRRRPALAGEQLRGRGRSARST